LRRALGAGTARDPPAEGFSSCGTLRKAFGRHDTRQPRQYRRRSLIAASATGLFRLRRLSRGGKWSVVFSSNALGVACLQGARALDFCCIASRELVMRQGQGNEAAGLDRLPTSISIIIVAVNFS
jgi:hypothetical protein